MKLRSRGWFGKEGKDGVIYRSWMKKQGIPSFEFESGKPIIGTVILGPSTHLATRTFAIWRSLLRMEFTKPVVIRLSFR
jgi:hypothetical protein